MIISSRNACYLTTLTSKRFTSNPPVILLFLNQFEKNQFQKYFASQSGTRRRFDVDTTSFGRQHNVVTTLKRRRVFTGLCETLCSRHFASTYETKFIEKIRVFKDFQNGKWAVVNLF